MMISFVDTKYSQGNAGRQTGQDNVRLRVHAVSIWLRETGLPALACVIHTAGGYSNIPGW